MKKILRIIIPIAAIFMVSFGIKSFDPSGISGRYLFNTDFTSSPTSTGASNDLFATNSGTGAGNSAVASDAGNHVGVNRTATGSTSTGRSAPTSASSSACRFGGGTWIFETLINVAALSTSSERFQLLVGFFDTYNAVDQTDGIYFLYDEGGVATGGSAQTYWRTVTASNGSRTFDQTGFTQTTVNAATWTKLRVEINAGATSIKFIIDGTTISTHTSNIPSGSGREAGFGLFLIKSVGSTSRTVDEDYLNVQSVFTTAR